MGAQFIVNNRVGASSNIGTAATTMGATKATR
jgi:hypothetical protein